MVELTGGARRRYAAGSRVLSIEDLKIIIYKEN
jgi:hypothetical protein